MGNTDDREEMVVLKNITKDYNLRRIGYGTLTRDLQSWWARVRRQPDPNAVVGREVHLDGDILHALGGVSLTVRQGECVGIIGRNGAGKSTLLKLISRVTTPTTGSIDLYGRVTSMLEVGTGFHPEMTGRENIYLNGAILGMSREEISAKMEDIIRFSEVPDFIDTPVKRYSSGMYVKLAFSVAAHLDSEIVIMDEVLAVGDAAFQKKCIRKMRSAAMDENRTVLYVSHNMNTVRELCDRCIVLSEGRIIFDGETGEAIRFYEGHLLTSNDAREKLADRVRRDKELSGICKMEDAIVLSEAVTADEALRFRLYLQAREETDNVCLRMIVCNHIGQLVGMTYSGCFTVHRGSAWYGFSFSGGPLSEGEYSCDIVLLSYNGTTQVRHDFLQRVLRFRVEDDRLYFGNRWYVPNWGNTKLPPIESEEVRE